MMMSLARCLPLKMVTMVLNLKMVISRATNRAAMLKKFKTLTRNNNSTMLSRMESPPALSRFNSSNNRTTTWVT